MAGIDPLASASHLDLLDVVDQLRAHGLAEYLPLPQLIVCGDQSSGKSSVLEAISRVPFPRKDNLCTRFATEVRLRRSAKEQIRVAIHPAENRLAGDKTRLATFQRTIDDVQELPQIVREATIAMGLGDTGDAFAEDRLHLVITGPKMPQLTIVDLPGLIHSENKQQSSHDVELIGRLVQHYMEQPRSIMLAIISAKYDIANQVVLKRTRDVDPTGKRTLGIITKPDKLDSSSESEKGFVNLATNNDIFLKLGWHVVRNLDQNTESPRENDRNEVEQRFFRTSIWRNIDPGMVGIPALRERLRQVLYDHMKREMPNVVSELEKRSAQTEKSLVRLGPSRATEADQRRFVLEISTACHAACCAGCDGNYDVLALERFTNDPTVRFRAVEKNESEKFRDRLHRSGAEWDIVDTPRRSREKSREATVDWAVDFIRTRRGRELPGTFNPLLIGQMFQHYSQPWAKITHDHVRRMRLAGAKLLRNITEGLVEKEVAHSIDAQIIVPAMKKMQQITEQKTQDLIRELRFVSTYNHYFTDTAAKIQQERIDRERRSQIQRLFNDHGILRDSHMELLITATTRLVDPDMTRAAAEDMVDYMLAYYKCCQKKFVDQIAVQVIEAEILEPLKAVFHQGRIFNMQTDVISEIASESEATRRRREQLETELILFKKCMSECESRAGFAKSSEAKTRHLVSVITNMSNTASDDAQSDTSSMSSMQDSIDEQDLDREPTTGSIMPRANPDTVPIDPIDESPAQDTVQATFDKIGWGFGQPSAKKRPKKKTKNNFDWPEA